MCCLFGFVDYGHQLSRKQRSRLLTVLSTACEERGTDATGIAYNAEGKLHIFKRPLPAHLMWYRVPRDATVVMGHTRMTTQGDARLNQNNHPFPGRIPDHRFALAHNGVLFNDKFLRKKYKLPATNVETDSYIAVQLLEQYGTVGFDGLGYMAEQLEGSFTFTILDDRDSLYFVKGSNPMCIYHYPKAGLYVYASTEDILRCAMLKTQLYLGKPEKIRLYGGDILRIDAHGSIARGCFDDSKLYASFFDPYPWDGWQQKESIPRPYVEEPDYLDDLKAVASCYGLYPEDVDALLADGVSMDEIEEYIYSCCG